MTNNMESIHQFKQNWLKKHPNEMGVFVHNVYHLISEDMDGNITDEKFGVNCMTDEGFAQYFRGRKTGLPRIFIGTGTSIPASSSKVMENPISNDSAVINNNYWTMELISQEYDSVTGITTTTFNAKTGYFDYTVFAEDKNITEIGMGDNVNDLIFHARVYDASGDPSTIVKHVNERLYISVYLTTGMKVKKMVEDAWVNGVYKLISPNMISWPYAGWGSSSNQVRCVMTPNHNRFYYDTAIGSMADGDGVVSNNIYTRDIQNFGIYLMEDQRRYVDNITVIDDSNGYAGKYVLTFKPRLSTALELTGDISTGFDTDSFSNAFGWPEQVSRLVSSVGEFPVIDADIQSSKMYNFTTHAWDISDTFTNPTTAQYDAYWLVHSIQYCYNNNDVLTTFRVFLNPYPSIPITKIENHGVAIYATDEYWDPSTLTLIDDPDNVSNALGTKKFYCVIGNGLPDCSTSDDKRMDHGWASGGSQGRYTIYVERDMSVHAITPTSQFVDVTYGEMTSSDAGNVLLTGKMVSNDSLGYIASAGMLMYPESVDPNATGGTGASASLPYRYVLYGHDGTTPSTTGLIWNTTAGNKIIVASNIKAGVRVYDVTSTASSAPTSAAYLFPTPFSNNPAISTSDNGWFVASYISGANNTAKTYVLSAGVSGIADAMYEVSDYDTAFCVDLTDYMCGHSYNASVDTFDIYNMKTKTVVSTFTLDTRYTYLGGGCGFKDYVYIRVHDNSVNTNKTYLYYISSDRLVLLDIDLQCMTFTTTVTDRCILCAPSPSAGIDAVMVIVATTQNQSSRHMIIKESMPENPIYIADVEGYTSLHATGLGWFGNIMDGGAQLKYVGNQLLLLANTSEWSSYYSRFDATRGPIVYNIGYICDNGTLTKVHARQYATSENRILNQTSCLYKTWVVRCVPQIYTGSGGSSKYYSWYKLIPFERYVPHRVTLRTRTINAYNNPVRVSNVRHFIYQASNDTSMYDPPV